jgi:hypothetical protein
MFLAVFTLLARLGAAAQVQRPERKPITNADVVGMVKAGLAESTVVLAIEQGATNFDTSPQALIALKNAGVSQKILGAMLTGATEKTTLNAKLTEPAAGGTGSGDNGNWEVSEEVSPMDGSRTVVLSLRAEQAVPSLVGLDNFPRLLIRCKAHQTDAFIHTGSLPFDVQMTGKHGVRLRFDNGQPFTQYWDQSTGYDSLFAPNAAGFARQLAASKKLAFEFTPSGSGPVATWFDLGGLDNVLDKVATACGWSVQATRDVHTVRNVFLQGSGHEVSFMQTHLEKHTCLHVSSLADADATLDVTDELHAKLVGRDGETL